MKNNHKPYGPYEKYFKRPLDFICALIAILLFWWLFIIIGILVKIKLGSPVLFAQDRAGKDEKKFKLYKFRTMTNEKDKDGVLLLDTHRLTKFGKMLRSMSLDEIPEVWNILKGDISICGPRPLVVQYLPFYNEEEKKRHDVLPGLTGLAQVNGRNAATWEERFSYDIKYVNHITFFGDIKIILLTINTVIHRSGIGVRGIDSPPDFDIYRKQNCEKEEVRR